MSDNWGFAVSLVETPWVVLMTDRFLPSKGSFERLEKALDRAELLNLPLIAWHTKSRFNAIRDTEEVSGIMNSREVLNSWLQFDVKKLNLYENMLPRFLNCAVHRSLVTAQKQKFGKLFPPYAPDYTFAASMAASNQEYLFLGDVFFESFGRESNGAAVGFNIDLFDFSALRNTHNDLPINDSVLKVVLCDILNIFDQYDRKVEWSPVNASRFVLLEHTNIFLREKDVRFFFKHFLRSLWSALWMEARNHRLPMSIVLIYRIMITRAFDKLRS
jgi:hypothetical protein